MRALWITAAIVEIAIPPAVAQTHCGANEIDYFSCKVADSDRVISVCGNIVDGEIAESSWLQYRFGRLGHEELVYPRRKKQPPVSAFEGEDFGRFQSVELRFINGNVLYSVTLNGTFHGDPSVDASPQSGPTGGVTAAFDSDRHKDFHCAKVDEKKYLARFEELAAALRRTRGDTDIAYDFYRRKRARTE